MPWITHLLSGFGTTDLGRGALIIVLVIMLDGILSVDNVAVLGTLVSHLPETELPGVGVWRIFPHWLRKNQRNAALTLGIGGAYVGRLIMLLGAAWIIANPSLKYVGGGYLLLLLWNHYDIGPWWLHPGPEWITSKFAGKNKGGKFLSTVINVEMTDLIFSLDNVVAVVALSSNLVIVFVGVCLSILIIRFFAKQFVGLVEKVPSLEHGAYWIVGFIGGRMILEQALGFHFPDLAQFVVSIVILVVFGVVGSLMARNQVPVQEAVSDRTH